MLIFELARSGRRNAAQAIDPTHAKHPGVVQGKGHTLAEFGNAIMVSSVTHPGLEEVAAATPGAGGFALPPEIQTWIKAGASMLPPSECSRFIEHLDTVKLPHGMQAFHQRFLSASHARIGTQGA